MRLVALVVLLGGCNLYFGHHHTEDDIAPPDYPDGGWEPWPVDAGGYLPGDSGTSWTPINPEVYACDDTGTCSVGSTDGCAAPLQCGVVVSAGACTCGDGTWACEPACNQGLCGAAAVQAKLVGDWTGTVTPPSFAQPYTVHLHIAADGQWKGYTTGAVPIPFYYGDNGGNPGSRIVVQAQTTVGGYASIGLFDGEVLGMITAIEVDDHTLTFSFVDSWLECTRTFRFDLHR